MSKFKDGWMRCPRCDSARTKRRPSRLSRIAGGIGGIFLYYNIFGISLEDEVALIALIVAIIVGIYLILKPNYYCKDCKHQWDINSAAPLS